MPVYAYMACLAACKVYSTLHWFTWFHILKAGTAPPACCGKSSATAAMHTADLALLQGLLLVVVWPCIVGFTAAGTFFTVRYQQQINQQLNTGFGSTICLSFINIISSQAVSYTTDFEQWHPNVRTNVSCPVCLPAAAPIAAYTAASVSLSVLEAAATTPATRKALFHLACICAEFHASMLHRELQTALLITAWVFSFFPSLCNV